MDCVSSPSTGRPDRASPPSPAPWPPASGSTTSTPARCTGRSPSPPCAATSTPTDADAVGALVPDLDIDVDDGVVLVDGVDATIEIRGPEVTRAVSTVAANPAVRAELVEPPAGSGPTSTGGGVIEGRDIGSVVFPDADAQGVPHRLARGPGRPPGQGGDRPRLRDGRRRPRPPRRPRPGPRGAARSPRPATRSSSTPPTARSTRSSTRCSATSSRPWLSAVTETDPLRRRRPHVARRRRRCAPVVSYAIVRGASSCVAKLFGRHPAASAPRTSRPTGAFVLAPVHRSNIDFALTACSPSGRCGTWARTRSGSRSRSAASCRCSAPSRCTGARADREACGPARRSSRAARPLVMFPEGTRRSGPSSRTSSTAPPTWPLEDRRADLPARHRRQRADDAQGRQVPAAIAARAHRRRPHPAAGAQRRRAGCPRHAVRDLTERCRASSSASSTKPRPKSAADRRADGSGAARTPSHGAPSEACRRRAPGWPAAAGRRRRPRGGPTGRSATEPPTAAAATTSMATEQLAQLPGRREVLVLVGDADLLDAVGGARGGRAPRRPAPRGPTRRR